MLFPDKARPEIADLVRDAILDLQEHGLIFVFRSDYDEAWTAAASDVDHLDGTEVTALLEADEWEEDRIGIPFFEGTEKGLEVLQGLPPGTVPKVSGNVPPWPDGTPPSSIQGSVDLSE